MKKRIIVTLLLIVLMFALFACGEFLPSGDDNTPSGDKPSGGDNPGGDTPVVDIEDGFFKSDMTLDEIVSALSSQVKSYSIDYEDKTTQYVGAKPGDENRNFSSHARFAESGYSYCYYKFEKNYEIAFFIEDNVYYELYNTGENTEYLVTNLTGYDYVVDFTQEITDPILEVIEFAKDGAEYKIKEGKLYLSKGDYEYVIYDVNNTTIAIPTDMSDYNTKEDNFPAMQFEPLEDDNTKVTFTRAHYYLKSVEIPQTIDGMSVVAISSSSFENNDYLKKVTIPGGITTIYPYAFANCEALTDIVYCGTMKEWNALVKNSELELPQTITVTCSDGVYDADEFILFKSEMTESEILNVINGSYRFEVDLDMETAIVKYYVDKTGIYCITTTGEGAVYMDIMFYSGSKWYVYQKGLEGEDYSITDFAGYEADWTERIKEIADTLHEAIIDSISEGYTIEDGYLKTGVYTMKFWDGESGVTRPEIFGMSIPVQSPLTFELSDDETYYILTDIHSILAVCEVPETYDGLPVKEISANHFSNLKKLVIPVCVEKLPTNADVNTLTIVYGGTMKEWNVLVKSNGCDIPARIVVTCSDGVFDKEDMFDFSDVTYCAFGDSITYGANYLDGYNQMENPYPKLVAETLGLKSHKNAGVSGATLVENVTGRACVEDIVANEKETYDIISVMAGVNDFSVGTPLGKLGDADASTIYGSLECIASTLKANNPNAFIFFMTPFQKGNGKEDNSAGYNLEDVANAVKEVAAKHSIMVLDMYNEGGYESHGMYGPNSDQLHPNQDFFVNYAAPQIVRFILENYNA